MLTLSGIAIQSAIYETTNATSWEFMELITKVDRGSVFVLINAE